MTQATDTAECSASICAGHRRRSFCHNCRARFGRLRLTKHEHAHSVQSRWIRFSTLLIWSHQRNNGPQGTDATYITGVNTAGTVRVNNLANMEALLNIIANGMEILGIAWGGPTMILGFMHMAASTQNAFKRVLMGAGGVVGGLATPGCINWLVASARDANLFS